MRAAGGAPPSGDVPDRLAVDMSGLGARGRFSRNGPRNEEPAPAGHVAELGQQERVPLDSMTRQGEVGHRAVQEQLTWMTMTDQP